MSGAAPAPEESGAQRSRREARRFVRASALFFVGRLIAVLVNFLVAVLAVRYLAKSDFGALAWAQSVAAFGAQAVLLGLNRGVGRFAAIHHERGEHGPMLGTIVLALGSVAGLGLIVVLVTLGLHGVLVHHVDSDLSVGLLMILIALAPLDALDALLETLMAVFAEVRAIFFRRYVLGPCLKLAAVLGVVALQGSVQMLAAAYVLAGVIGIALYSTLLFKVLAGQGLWAHLRPRPTLPARTLFGFSLPVLSTDVILGLESTMVVVLLERFRGTVEVAELQVALQVAGLCLLVFQISKILFKPAASRLYARGDQAGLGDLYWRSASWIAIATFPVFATCLFLADPIVRLLFGPGYSGAALLLAILAVGKYVNAAMGMNTQTLQVHARVGLILGINTASAVLGLILCLGLIPRFGAVGAAIAGSGAIVIRNLLNQVGLAAAMRSRVVPGPTLKLYGSVLVTTAVLGGVWLVADGVLVIAPAIAAASALLPWLNRHYLDIANTFPELRMLRARRRSFGRPDQLGAQAP
jgi:O-antigen/teichoic acid export membrane protein